MTTAEKRVKRGAALLDKDLPGWFRKVDVHVLDVQDTARCVVGQCYGSWIDGTGRLGLRDGVEQSEHGFNLAWEEYNSAWEDAYVNELNLLWVKEIEARRGRI